MSDKDRQAAIMRFVESILPPADDRFLAAADLLTPEEETACGARAAIGEQELLTLANAKLSSLPSPPRDPEQLKRFHAAVVFTVMAERYREVVIEVATEKRKTMVLS